MAKQRETSARWRSLATIWAALFLFGGCASPNDSLEPDEDYEESPSTSSDDEDPDQRDDEEGERADQEPDTVGSVDAARGQVRDAGAQPSPSRDAQVAADAQVVRDAQVARDAQVERDARAPADAGAMATGDAGSARADAGSSADAGSAGDEDLGEGDGRDVITIGDSWMRLILTGIETGLVKASGNQRYRTYGVPATRLLDGAIPGQYTSAKRAGSDIKTVVMTAGGNDVIQNAIIEADCADGGRLCEEQLNEIREALAALWAEMSEDGVRDVIHVMYSASAASGVKNREAHNEKLAATCAAVPAPLRCHLLNTDDIIKRTDLRLDGIHPDDDGYDRIGKAVYDLMVERGMRR